MSFFKANNPFSPFLLFIYTLVLKLGWFMHPHPPFITNAQDWLSPAFVNNINSYFAANPLVYDLLVYTLFIAQALMINRNVNAQRMLQKPSFAPAMCYILITSLFGEWNIVSPALLITTLVIGIWSMLTRLHNNSRPKTSLFNIGMLIGVTSFFYFPILILGAALLVAVFFSRPFRVHEWLVAIIGFFMPWYFMLAILYLVNGLTQFTIPRLLPRLPYITFDRWQWAAIILLGLAFIIGVSYVQSNLRKQVVQVRKTWYHLAVYLVFSILISLFFSNHKWQYYLLAAVPLTVYVSAAFFYPRKRWLPVILHWALFAFVIAFSYFKLV